jgi:hypothetical protein
MTLERPRRVPTLERGNQTRETNDAGETPALHVGGGFRQREIP